MADESDYGAEAGGAGGLMNYKGIYFNDDPNNKYTCPRTGAHFEFDNMCGRLNTVIKWRKIYEMKIAAYAKAGKFHQGIAHVTVDDEELEMMTTKDREEQLRREKQEFMRKMGMAKKKPSVSQVQATTKLQEQSKPKSKQGNSQQAAPVGAAHRRHANYSQERVKEPVQR